MAFAQHTLGLTLAQLASIVGREAVERMQELPMQLLRQRSDEASARAREVARALRDEDQATPPMAGLASSRLEAALGEARAAAEAMRKGATSGFTVQRSSTCAATLATRARG